MPTNDYMQFLYSCEHRMFNTGDQIWFIHDDTLVPTPQSKVIRVLTHDGWSWEEGQSKPMIRLTGLEMLSHRCKMFWHQVKQRL